MVSCDFVDSAFRKTARNHEITRNVRKAQMKNEKWKMDEWKMYPSLKIELHPTISLGA